MTAIYIIVAILFFGLLVAIHEFGHFITAKLCNVRVNEFSIGLGPAIFKKQKGETLYSLRCIPFGGFCAMQGEDELVEDERGFTSQVWWKRAIILVAGSAMNFLLGLLILIILYSNAAAFRVPVIAGFFENCPYESVDGLQEGDRFYKIDGHRIYEYYDVSDYLHSSEEHDIVLIRDGKKVTLNDYRIVPVEYPGYQAKMYGFTFGIEEATLPVKLSAAWNTSMEFARMVWQSLSELFSGNVGVDDLSGPVGIVDMMAQTGEQAESVADAFFDIFYFGAFIAINLAVMNMLPIPALDGGRIFLLLVTLIIEKLIRKKLDPKYEGYIHAAGMVLLLALMAFIMFHDVFRLVTK